MTPTTGKKRGRPSLIDQPPFVKLLSALLARGLSRAAVMEELEAEGYTIKDPDTISRWRRDPRVKAETAKLIEDRALEISRKIDAKIEAILSQGSLTVKELIMIRKEYGGTVVGRKEVADDSITAQAMKALEENPDIGNELAEMLEQAAQ